MTRINQPYTNFTPPPPNVYDLSLGAVLGPPPPAPCRTVSLTELVNAREAQLCEQRKENALLRGIIDELRADARSEARRLAAERDASMRHAKTITGLRADAIASRKTIADLRVANDRLVGRLDHLQKVNDTLRSPPPADEEIKGLKNRVTDLENKNKMLLRSRDNLQKANDTLRSQASDRRVEAVGLREQLREQGKRFASSGESQSYMMLCDERKVTADLRKTNEALRTAMASKHKRMLEANSLITSLRGKLEALADLNDVYYKRLNELQKVNTTPDCSTEVASLKRDLASRDCVIQDAAKRVRWLEACQTNQAETIAEHRDAKAKLNRDISQLQSTIMRYVEDLRLVRKVNAELLAERAAGLNASATTERRTLQQVIDRMRRDGNHLMEVIGQRNTEIKDMKRRVQLLDALLVERNGTIQDRRRKIQATQDEVVALNRTVKDLKRLLSTKNKTIADREAVGRLLHREIDIYKEDRDIARKDAYNFRVARDFAQSALAVEKGTSVQLGGMVKALSANLDGLTDRGLGEWNMTTTSRREP